MKRPPKPPPMPGPYEPRRTPRRELGVTRRRGASPYDASATIVRAAWIKDAEKREGGNG